MSSVPGSPSPTGDEIALDDLGDMEVNADFFGMAREHLAKDWPNASPDALDEAAELMAAHTAHTARTGRMSYAAADVLGAELAAILTRRSSDG